MVDVTWIQSNTGLPTPLQSVRMQFELSASSPLIIYALIYNNSTLPGGQILPHSNQLTVELIGLRYLLGYLFPELIMEQQPMIRAAMIFVFQYIPTNPNIVCFGNVELSRTNNGSTISFVRNPSGAYGGT